MRSAAHRLDDVLALGGTGVAVTAPSARRARPRRRLDEAALAIALPYRHVELLATGGMSLVYRAQNGIGMPPVAVKVLRPALAGDDLIVERFLAERELSRRIDHPGVVPVFAAGQVEGVPYLVMELVEGNTLGDLADGPLDLALVTAIGAQIASALAASHAAGVVHCDVKPDNILVQPRAGEPPRVKLIDFGVARRVGAPAEAADAVTGTPLYMSPEQWRGRAEPASDGYALGCVLYQLVTGRPPFRGSFTEVMTAHLEHAPTPPSALRADVPAALEALILALLAKDPAARPASLDLVARQLAAG